MVLGVVVAFNGDDGHGDSGRDGGDMLRVGEGKRDCEFEDSGEMEF